MRCHLSRLVAACIIAAVAGCSGDNTPKTDTAAPAMAPPPAADTIEMAEALEGYPRDVIQALSKRGDAVGIRAKIAVQMTDKMRTVIQSVFVEGQSWPNGTVTVAFNGGSAQLREQIAETARVWGDTANVRFDFWTDGSKKAFRTWNPSDADYAADIRISFEEGGSWSVIGIDAIAKEIRGPGQASMNLGGFARPALPTNWHVTTVHEFGHALGFQHEHQSPAADCIAQYRWDDGPYKPTKARDRSWGVDVDGNYPGVYTYLGGPPNEWIISEVDFNLRRLPYDRRQTYEISPYDSMSIMHYAFPSWMFVMKDRARCYRAPGSITTLSTLDRRAAAKAYPILGSEKRMFEMRIDSAIARKLGRTFSSPDAAKLSTEIKTMRAETVRVRQ